MMTTSCSKYVAFVRIAMARARHDRGELIGRMAFFAVILGVFSSLWRAVGEAGMPIGGDPKLFVWYLATTEWILLSAPMVHGDVQESIRRGDVVYQLGRPVSYPGAAFAEAAGMLVFRAPILAATAWICAFAFTGWAPPLWPLASTLPFGFASALLITALNLWIGLQAFWLDDVLPVYWIVQKLLFVLGGLMLPIEFYPAAMQTAAGWTPFPAMLAGPASFVLHQSSAGGRSLALQLTVWGVLIGAAVRWTFRRAAAALTVNGG